MGGRVYAAPIPEPKETDAEELVVEEPATKQEETTSPEPKTEEE